MEGSLKGYTWYSMNTIIKIKAFTRWKRPCVNLKSIGGLGQLAPCTTRHKHTKQEKGQFEIYKSICMGGELATAILFAPIIQVIPDFNTMCGCTIVLCRGKKYSL